MALQGETFVKRMNDNGSYTYKLSLCPKVLNLDLYQVGLAKCPS